MPFVLPQNDVHNSAVNQGDHQGFGVLNADGNACEDADHYRAGRCLTSHELLSSRLAECKNAKRLDGRWLYGGLLNPHFGHFLSESVHRLATYSETPGVYDGIIFLKSPLEGRFDWDPWTIEHIRATLGDYFGIRNEKVIFASQPLDVPDLEIIRQSHQLGAAPSQDYLARLQLREEAYRRIHTPKVASADRIFLSRRNYFRKGRALGMAAIEAVFENNGYEIVCPELLTFADQVAAVVSAQHVAAEEGSALHLYDILGPQDSSLTVLSRRGPSARYWQRYLSPRVQTFRAFDSVVPLHDYFGHQAHSSYALMNPSVAAEFLVGLGLQLDRAAVVDAITAATMQDLRDLGLQFPS